MPHRKLVPPRKGWRDWWKGLTTELRVAVLSLLFVALTFIAAALVVPEVRRALHLEKPETPTVEAPKPKIQTPGPLKPNDLDSQPKESTPPARFKPLPNPSAPDEQRTLFTKNPDVHPFERAGFVFVDEAVAKEHLIRRVEPVFPSSMLPTSEAKLTLNVEIDTDGTIKSIDLLQGDPAIAQAAADAVKQWRYKPFLNNGYAESVNTRVTFDVSSQKK